MINNLRQIYKRKRIDNHKKWKEFPEKRKESSDKEEVRKIILASIKFQPRTAEQQPILYSQNKKNLTQCRPKQVIN
jgi:hypothetical protein